MSYDICSDAATTPGAYGSSQQPEGAGRNTCVTSMAKEVRGCRSALGKRASALLIVVVDADTKTTASRAAQLSDALDAAEEEKLSATEPVVVLIPKRNVETWIRALLGSAVDEITDYKKPVPTSAEIKNSADELYKYTRPSAQLPAGYPSSLTQSIPEWRKIPS